MDYVPTSFGDVNPFGENFDIKKAAGAFGIYQLGKKLLGTPKEVEESQEAQPQQEFIAPEAPTPTSDAMKMNQVYRPPTAVEENTNTGLMTAV